MNRIKSAVGVAGTALALGGLIAYTVAPDKLWLVTLCEGLALVCLIAFFVFHFEYLKAFSVRRSTRLGANSILMVGLFFGILAIVNFLAARHAERWDWSETQRFSLAPQTYRVLRNLDRDVTVTVFSQDRSPGQLAYRDLLDTYRHASSKLTVRFVDPEREPQITRQHGITRTDTAVVESGPHTTRVTTPSEADLTGALIRVSREGKKRILFLEGHGERRPEDTERIGLSLATEALDNQGYEVGSLFLLKEEAVPEDTSVLVIAGPQRQITPEERERLKAYVQQGGRLLVMVDPHTDTGLDDLLHAWGLRLGAGVLVDLQDRVAQGDLTALLVRTFTEHEITQDFAFAVLFPLARPLTIEDQRAPEWEIVPLARTSPRSWAETDLQGRVVRYDEGQDVQGPLPLAVAITPKTAAKEPPEDGEPRPAIVVVGNSAFASNAYLNFPGNTDFLLHTIGWLAEERELISITPKEPAFRPFIPNPTQERLLLYVQVLFLPVATFLWGIAIWRKRRRL